MIVGEVRSPVHVTVLEVVEVLPHASKAVNVLSSDLVQPLVVIEPSTDVIVGVLHASVAVALPSAALISEAVGLHPRVNVVPIAVIVGGVRSIILIVAGDSIHPLIVLTVPAGVVPHTAVRTYLVFIL